MQEAFIWSEHIWEVVSTAFLSMVPMFEGRYAVATGIAMGMPPVYTYLLALLFSTIPMPLIMWLFRPILRWLYTLPIKPLQKFAAWVDRRAEKGAGKVSKAGFIGLYLFVAAPLPGTGVWTGSAVATILEMDRKRAAIAIVLGNMTAILIMTLIATGVVTIAGIHV